MMMRDEWESYFVEEISVKVEGVCLLYLLN